MPAQETTYRPAGRIVIRRIGDDQLLVPVSGGAACENVVFPVNPTALFVWERLSAGKTICETAREMCEVFAVEMDECVADCEDLAQRLMNQNLLEVVSS